MAANRQSVNGLKNKGTSSVDSAGFPDQRRRLFTFVVVVGSAAILLGGIGLYQDIVEPFPQIAPSNTPQETADVLALKNSDTDSDTLSDYDEIYTYRTSVFVQDSDSDGATDADEVEAGTDPNCPTGINCAPVVTNTNTSSSAEALALRQTLQNAGVPAAVLQATDDASLLRAYSDVVGGASTNSSVSGGNLSGLSASQVRELLQSSGLGQDTLSQVDDATLLQIFRDAITID